MIEKLGALSNLRLAVLIDADNVPRNCIKGVMEEITLYGTPTVKRIYGDWTSPTIAGWKTSLLEHAITPIQQYGYTTGKNSTDSAMIIDAMDILYAGRTDGFVIVSSDSDFTRLAIRLREAGQRVIGIGERKTPGPFIVACDKFIYIEVIRAHQNQQEEQQQGKRTPDKPKAKPPERPPERAPEKSQPKNKGQSQNQNQEKQQKQDRQSNQVPVSTLQLIADSIADIADDDGYAYLGELGNLLLKKQPDFDPRNFGFSKLTPLLKSLPQFEIDVRQTGDVNIKHIYVKDREVK